MTQQDVDNVINSIENPELSAPQSRGLPTSMEKEIKFVARNTINQPPNIKALGGSDESSDPTTKVRNDNPTISLISQQTIFAV